LLRAVSALPRAAARHPWRFLGATALLLLIGLLTLWIGGSLWADYQLRAARRESEKYHDQGAYKHLVRCLRVRPNDPDALFLLARAARRIGALEEADRALDRYQQRRGADESLVLERMLLRAERGAIDEVNKFFQARIEEDHPDASLILEAVTRGFIRNYRLRDAGVAMGQWLEREPDNTQALLFQGIVYDLRQRLSDALVSYRRVVELDPDHDEGRYRLAGALIHMSQTEEALPHLKFLVKRQPDNVEFQVLLAQCHEQVGNVEEAATILDGVLARDPKQPLALAERGRLARRAGQLAEAEEWLKKAVALDPGSYTTRYQLFLCLEQRNKLAEARQEQERMQRLQEDLQQMQKIMTDEMQRRPRDPELHYKVAMIAFRSGAVKDALRWLHSAVEVSPNHGPSHRALAGYYRRAGNPALAAHHRQRAEQAGEKLDAPAGAQAPGKAPARPAGPPDKEPRR
jgi:tetratricopeptide (TPR) repeat protein